MDNMVTQPAAPRSAPLLGFFIALLLCLQLLSQAAAEDLRYCYCAGGCANQCSNRLELRTCYRLADFCGGGRYDWPTTDPYYTFIIANKQTGGTGYWVTFSAIVRGSGQDVFPLQCNTQNSDTFIVDLETCYLPMNGTVNNLPFPTDWSLQINPTPSVTPTSSVTPSVTPSRTETSTISSSPSSSPLPGDFCVLGGWDDNYNDQNTLYTTTDFLNANHPQSNMAGLGRPCGINGISYSPALDRWVTLQRGSSCNGPSIMWADSSDLKGAAGTANWRASGNINTIMRDAFAAHWAADTWVAVGCCPSTIATSFDGITWTGLGPLVFPGTGHDVSYGLTLGSNAGLWIAVGGSYGHHLDVWSTKLATSPNGWNWIAFPQNTFVFNGYPIWQYIWHVEFSYDLRRWVISGQCFAGILDPPNIKFCAMWSDDGFTWTLGDYAPGTPKRQENFMVKSLVWSDGLNKWLLGVVDASLYESSDGKFWSLLHPPNPGNRLNHFDYSPVLGRYVLMGRFPTVANNYGLISSTDITSPLSTWDPIERANGLNRRPFEDTPTSAGYVSLCQSNTGGPANRFDLNGKTPSPIPDPCKAATTCGACNALNEGAIDRRSGMLSTAEIACVWCGPSKEPSEESTSGQCVYTLQHYSRDVDSSNNTEVAWVWDVYKTECANRTDVDDGNKIGGLFCVPADGPRSSATRLSLSRSYFFLSSPIFMILLSFLIFN